MKITLDRNTATPLYLQIKKQIQQLILNGTLLPGSKLLSERKLADQLSVNRTTVMNAYQELKAEGLAKSVRGSGTIVQKPVDWTDNPIHQKPPTSGLAKSLSRANPIQQLLSLPSGPDHISFAVGKPDPECIPLPLIQQIQSELITDMGDKLFQHCPSGGNDSLRASVTSWMKQRGVQENAANDVLIVSGAQQGLDLIARTLIEPGDIVLVEEPTYFSAVQLFRLYGATTMTIPTDAGGNLDLMYLENLLMKHRPKLLNVQPTFQNPTGRVMPLEQRKQLMDLVERHRTFVIEEDPYYELRYEQEHLPPLKAFDPMGNVIYVGTFSKLLFPGMRIGWIYAEQHFIETMVSVKQWMDLHVNHWAQAVTDRILRHKEFKHHLSTCRKVYKAKRDRMTKLLIEQSNADLQFTIPQGGYYLWVRVPEQISTTVLLMHALEANVSFVPGTYFSFEGTAHSVSYIRLNFTFPTLSQIEQGIETMTQLMKQISMKYKTRQKNIGQSMPLI